MKIGAIGVFSVVSLVGWAGALHAQDIIAGQDVSDRAHPEYDPYGVPLGPFTLFPSVLTQIDVTDNYRATPTNRQSDLFATVRPELLLKNNSARHRLQLRTYLNEEVHARLGTENATTFGGSASDVFDVSRLTQLRVDLGASHEVENRANLSSFRGTAEPVRYDNFRAAVSGWHAFNQLTVRGNGALEYRNFHDARLAGGGTIDQDYRDVRNLSVGAGAQYNLVGGTGVSVNAQYDDSHYDNGPTIPGFDIDRNSSGVTVDAGVNLELSSLIYGSVRAGYLTRRYADPRLHDVSGPTFTANLLWNATPLTSVRFSGRRSIEASGSTQFAGNTRSDVRLTVHHELYRSVLLTGDANYGRFTPNGIGPHGNEYAVAAGVRYLLNRRLTLRADVRHSGRNANVDFLDYSASSASASLKVAL